MIYSLPRDVSLLLEPTFNQDRDKAEIFAKAIEGSIQVIEAKEFVRAELNALRAEFRQEFGAVHAEFGNVNAKFAGVDAEFSSVRAEINELRSEIRHNSFVLRSLMAIPVFGMTLFNPSFVKLVEVLSK